MYAIINNTGDIAVPLSILEQLTKVERIGDYNSTTFKKLGVPTNITLVQNESLVSGDEAVQAEEKSDAVKLKAANAELAKLKLQRSRDKNLSRLVERGCNKQEAINFLDSCNYTHQCDQAEQEDIVKFIRKSQEA